MTWTFPFKHVRSLLFIPTEKDMHSIWQDIISTFAILDPSEVNEYVVGINSLNSCA